MHSDDAVRAYSLGVDGIKVSNHVMRQLDNAAPPLQVRPASRDASGGPALQPALSDADRHLLAWSPQPLLQRGQSQQKPVRPRLTD